MCTLAFFPADCRLDILHIEEEGDSVTLQVQTTASSALCPDCGQLSQQVHSRYTRTLKDLAFTTKSVEVVVLCRRFFCANLACLRRTFAEALTGLTRSHARSTTRLDDAHRHIGFANGGEVGARLAALLHIPISAAGMLRRLKNTNLTEDTTSPQVVGVDDWALRKGQRYGTIVCDLQRHCAIDLLADRSAESTAQWLKEHPEVKVVSRDRGDPYIRGATEGAPNAIQVADRFHLVKNAHEALQRVVDRLAKMVRQTSQQIAAKQDAEPDTSTIEVASSATESSSAADSSEEQMSQTNTKPEKADPRKEMYLKVRQLHAQGNSQREIARRLSLDRATVSRYVQAESFPQRAVRRLTRNVDRFVGYLRKRFEEGYCNAEQLTKEIREKGYTGSYYSVRRLLAQWRPEQVNRMPKPVQSRCPSARQVSWWLLRPEQDLDKEQMIFVKELQQRSPEIRKATEIIRGFREMVRERQAEKWSQWVEQVNQPGTARELQSFATGLKSDELAVKAALSSPWSNGQVEGQVNKLKTLKRQMYGRASFHLLRIRFLHRNA